MRGNRGIKLFCHTFCCSEDGHANLVLNFIVHRQMNKFCLTSK